MRLVLPCCLFLILPCGCLVVWARLKISERDVFGQWVVVRFRNLCFTQTLTKNSNMMDMKRNHDNTYQILMTCNSTKKRTNDRHSMSLFFLTLRFLIFSLGSSLCLKSSLAGCCSCSFHHESMARMKEFDKAMAEKNALMADAEKCQNKLNMAQRHSSK